MKRRRDDGAGGRFGSSWRDRAKRQGQGGPASAPADDAGSAAEADSPAAADTDATAAPRGAADPGRSQRPRPTSTAYGKALGLLSRREHSQRELKRKLDHSGFAGDEAAQALQRLQQQSFQSDARFAELLVRSRVSQGHGPRRIRAELRTHGISDEEAQQALDQQDEDWLALARRVYRRRFGTAAGTDRQESHRRAGFLLRRGFDAATVRAITHADDVDDSAEEFD